MTHELKDESWLHTLCCHNPNQAKELKSQKKNNKEACRKNKGPNKVGA